ncbi:MAG: radical SAM protein [Flavonifractor plautii]
MSELQVRGSRWQILKPLRLRHKAEYPQIHLCLSTNGLFLPEQASRLAQLGVETLTVTVNAHTPNVAVHIYEHVSGERGENAVRRLLERQRTGVKEAVKAGMVVKINSVYVPGINDDDILQISREMRAIGATLQNILPVIARDTVGLLRRTRAVGCRCGRGAASIWNSLCAGALPCRHCGRGTVLCGKNEKQRVVEALFNLFPVLRRM